MRVSRLSQETSKLPGIMPSPTSPVRRITRGSLARFAYNDGSSSKENPTPTIPDIEDAALTTMSKKRKRNRASSPAAAVKAEEVNSTVTLTTTPRRARKPARKATDPTTGEHSVTPPSDWEEMYDIVKAMRLGDGPAANAAVDTMGCERLALSTASPRDQRFHTLVALMLSSQTKDTTNAVAMRHLQTELPSYKPEAPPGLNLENMLAVDPEKLNRLIWVVGFHNNKTKYLKQAAVILRDKWGGDIPDSIEGLTSLPGVGPKMAHLCLSAAWGRTEGIGVDVHVHRITNLWGWHKTKNPEETRMALQSWLPRERWREINWLLVGFGQTVCLPVGRKCGDCELGLRGLCKAAERGKVLQGRKVRESRVEIKGDGTVKNEEVETVEAVARDEVVNEEMNIHDQQRIKKEEVDQAPLEPARKLARNRI
ncbi:putative DNA repair protein NTG1 [Pseudomassariella vexata]|uniref:Endonuclease III homolog n=1 Tax=Pseudomassariella vexata TaxID=1141098 RepID=A0A1Y2DUR7_9PEZI|nr:putative DNA repair protein NTG1 [Pseudomassariella vexata]ORY63022.1 putative DNA repair protein NTG1 [Pseudomassariella vexata]